MQDGDGGRPGPRPTAGTGRVQKAPDSPYEKVAAELSHVADIAADHDVSFDTAQRALTLLKNEGLIVGACGQPLSERSPQTVRHRASQTGINPECTLSGVITER